MSVLPKGNKKSLPKRRSRRLFVAAAGAAALSSLAGVHLARASQWTGASANWSSNANPGWNGTGVPNAVGAIADHAVSTSSTTTIDGAYTVGGVSLTNNSSNSWSFTTDAARTLTLDQVSPGTGTVTISNTNTNAGTSNTLSFDGLNNTNKLTLSLSDNLLISNTGNSTRTVGSGGAITFGSNSIIAGTGNITITNSLNDTATQTGSIRFNGGANTFTGTVLIQNGLTTFNANTSFGGVAGNTITIGQSAQGSATLFSTTGVTVVNNLVAAASTGGTSILGSTSTSSVNYNGTLLLNGDLSVQSSSTGANSLTLGGIISGVGALTKSGTGNAIFNKANTYQGGTTISAGTLLVTNTSGSGTGTGPVTVAGGAVLGGSGTISGSITTGSSTAQISPGNTVGTLTVGALNASAGANFVFEIGATSGGAASDLLALVNSTTPANAILTGSSASGALVFDFTGTGSGPVAGTPYTLITFASSTGLDYTDLASTFHPGLVLDPGFGGGGNGFNITSTSLQVQFSVVPEPTSLGGLIGLGGLAALRPRRRA